MITPVLYEKTRSPTMGRLTWYQHGMEDGKEIDAYSGQ